MYGRCSDAQLYLNFWSGTKKKIRNDKYFYFYKSLHSYMPKFIAEPTVQH